MAPLVLFVICLEFASFSFAFPYAGTVAGPKSLTASLSTASDLSFLSSKSSLPRMDSASSILRTDSTLSDASFASASSLYYPARAPSSARSFTSSLSTPKFAVLDTEASSSVSPQFSILERSSDSFVNSIHSANLRNSRADNALSTHQQVLSQLENPSGSSANSRKGQADNAQSIQNTRDSEIPIKLQSGSRVDEQSTEASKDQTGLDVEKLQYDAKDLTRSAGNSETRLNEQNSPAVRDFEGQTSPYSRQISFASDDSFNSFSYPSRPTYFTQKDDNFGRATAPSDELAHMIESARKMQGLLGARKSPDDHNLVPERSDWSTKSDYRPELAVTEDGSVLVRDALSKPKTSIISPQTKADIVGALTTSALIGGAVGVSQLPRRNRHKKKHTKSN